jgi:hypothetical protein
MFTLVPNSEANSSYFEAVQVYSGTTNFSILNTIELLLMLIMISVV